MTNISAKDVKALRDRVNAGMMDCKRALEEAGGDQDKAVEWLRKKGLADDRKSARVAAEGMVGSYLHMGGKIGVMVEVNCETDFVARSDDFRDFVKELAMHIAAAAPRWLVRQDVPEAEIAKEREVFRAQVAEAGKPEAIAGKIVEGKLDKWFGEVCLMEQPWVKEAKMTIEALRADVQQKTGEKIAVRRFVRFVLGEGIEKRKENLAEEIAKMQDAARQAT